MLIAGAAGLVASILIGQRAPDSGEWLFLAAPLLLAFGYVVSLGPKWCLALLLGSVVLGMAQIGTAVGPVDLRVPDLFFVALLVWALVLRGRGGQRGYIVGRPWLAVWLGALGLSLYPLLVQGTIGLDGLVPWLRLVATLSLVWLVPYAIRTRDDFHFVLGALALAGTFEVGAAVVDNLSRGDLVSRLEGSNGPNTTGLIAALVVILAIHGPVPRRWSLRIAMLIIGATGLLMTRSLGGTAALVVALAVYGLTNVRTWGDRARSGLITPWRILAVLLLGLAVATLIKPTNLPGAEEFDRSSTAHRLVLADTGLRLFAENPLTGIGWQRTPDEIRSREIDAELRARWDWVNPNFYPRQNQQGTTVHNTYVQILAETGVVGFVLFLVAFFMLSVGTYRILRSARANPAVFVCARAALVLLVGTLVWLNDNPLYGAQPESVLGAAFLGLLAAVAPILEPDAAPVGRSVAVAS